MAATKPNQRQSHLLVVAQMMTEGYGTNAIAVATNRSPGQITYDKKKVVEKWQKEAVDLITFQKAVALRQTESILNESIIAWKNSQETRTTTQRKARQSGQGSTPVQESMVKEEECHGDPRYLSVAMDAIRTKANLIGLNAPKEVDATVEHTGNVVHTSVGLSETMALLAEAATGDDQGPLPQPVPVGPVLSSPVRTPTNGRGTSVDTGQMPGSPDEP